MLGLALVCTVTQGVVKKKRDIFTILKAYFAQSMLSLSI